MRKRKIHSNRDRHLVVAVAVCFVLTIVSIVTSRTITEIQSRRIQRDANSIRENALVAAEALIGTRTDLRRLVFQLNRLRATTQPRTAAELGDEIAVSRREARRNVEKYLSVPFYPREEELVQDARKDLRSLDRALDEIVERLDRGERKAALDVIEGRALPLIARSDDALEHLLLFNRREAHVRATRIVASKRPWEIIPDLVGALFTVAVAYFGLRVLVRYLAWAKERSAELEQFAGRVAHDMRSPLGSVSLAVDLAQRSKDIDPKMRALLARVMATIRRVGQLIDGLLVFATSGGYLVPESAGERKASVLDVLDGVVEDQRLEAEMKGVELDYEPPEPALVVACSPGVLISMLTNLISNAMKFMGDAPVRRVILRVRKVEPDVLFEVSDTGPGIAPELRPKIFQPYVRGESKAPGFGLGLATVRKLAEAHGGEVGVENTTAGGCRFWFQLPVWTEARERRPWAPMLRPRQAT